MNACPNCGAELKFDIASQKLACPFCGAKIDPSAYTEFGAAAEEVHVSMDAAAGTEEGIAQDVVQASPVIPETQNGYGQPAQGSGMLGPSGGNLGPSGSFASQGGVPVGGGFMQQGTGVSNSFASQAGTTSSGAGFAGEGVGTSGSFASQGAAPLGGGFMQQGQGGTFGSSTGFAASGSASAAAAQTAATASFLGSLTSAESAALNGTPQPMGNAAQGFAQPQMGFAQSPQAGYQAQPQQQQAGNAAPSYVPYDYDPTANAQELEVIAYSCPQCGGSIYSTDESVNGFCSFCGSNITLQSRMARMKYPKFVLPFRVNKNACKQYYLNHVKKAFFAPKELKNPEYLERFRGIYMPYWGYDVMYYGNLVLDGTKSYRRGDYIYTEHYMCGGLVDAFYKGLSYDASSSFDDHFSEQIAPYDAHAMIDFNPAYLSGFYADLQDVSYHTYEAEAIRFGQKQILNSFRKKDFFSGLNFADNQIELIRPTIDALHDGVYTAFFPVWFLSYRNNDRVAYAVVNGQTGKLISDLPVDKKKFMISAVLMSIPLFFLLLGLPVLMPATMVILAELLSVFAVVLLTGTVSKVYIRDKRMDDKGFLSKSKRMGQQAYTGKGSGDGTISKLNAKKSGGGGATAAVVLIMLLAAIGPMIGFVGEELKGIFSNNATTALVTLVLAVVLVVLNAATNKKAKELDERSAMKLFAGIWGIIVVCIASGVVILLDPVSNFPYYICAILLFIGTLLAQLMALDQYNLLTTRPLPQLNRKGGDDSAQD